MSTSTLYIDNIYNKAGTGGPNFSNGITTTGVNGGQLGGMRNLIINGNFQVNQRGAASITATTSDYNYDRWYYDGTYLYQGVEDKNVFNGTYTLSWQDAGSDITASYVVSTDTTAGDGPDSGQIWTTVSNGGNITVNEGTEYSKHLWVRFGGTLTNLSKVQLEMGSTATPFEQRPYGTELALCQRYCIVYESPNNNSGPYFIGLYNSDTNPRFFAELPVPMRSSPTLFLSDVSDFSVNVNGSTQTLSGLTFNGLGKNNLSHLMLSGTTSDANNLSRACYLRSNGTSGSKMIFDSEL